MHQLKNYYSALELKPGAPPEEVKASFKRLAFQYHPDRNPHNPEAEERFKAVVEAYAYFTGNQEAYRALQRQPKSSVSSSAESQDILKILFGLDIRQGVKKRDLLRVPLDLTLEEAFLGCVKRIDFEREDVCASCCGSGVEKNAKAFTCTYCFGGGEISSQRAHEKKRSCPKCNGRGFLSAKGCLACRAHGRILKKVKRRIQITPKTKRNQIIRLVGEGHETKIGQRDELWVVIGLKKHPRFTFDDENIMCEITVPASDAVYGLEIKVPTLTGPINLKIPAGTQSGKVFVLKDLGLGGDQLLRVQVDDAVPRESAFMRSGMKAKIRGRLQKIKTWLSKG